MKESRTTHAGEPGSTPLRSPTNPPHRILVVDEDSDLRQLYAEALAGPAYHVDAAEDGATAWEALKTNRYHLLITEHEMPKLTGVIRLTIKFPHTVLGEVIKITHRGNPQERRIAHLPYLPVMKANQEKKALTLGDLIKGGCRACGRRRATGIIRLAAKARLIVFQGHGPFVVS